LYSFFFFLFPLSPLLTFHAFCMLSIPELLAPVSLRKSFISFCYLCLRLPLLLPLDIHWRKVWEQVGNSWYCADTKVGLQDASCGSATYYLHLLSQTSGPWVSSSLIGGNWGTGNMRNLAQAT
jgi:hypothetical protein